MTSKFHNKRTFYIDIANVVSALAVIILHTNGVFWIFSTEKYWFNANIIECVFYFAVPVFLMNSGATLFDFYDRYGLKEYFKKRVLKVLLPYIFWSLIYIVFFCFVTKTIPLEQINFSFVVKKLLNGTATSIFYFFIALINVYLSVPLFAVVEKAKRKRLFSYLALAGFILNILIPFINNVFKIDLGYSFSVAVVRDYLFYLVAGYLISNYDLDKKKRYIIYILGFIGLLLHMVGTYKLSMASLKIEQLYKGYVNVPCVMYSVAIYLFIKYSSKYIKNTFLSNIILLLRQYTFSFYLLHYMVIDLLKIVLQINVKSVWWQLFGFVPISIIVCVFSYFIRKLPYGKALLP